MNEFLFSVYHKRNDFSPSVKEILKKYGNNRITHIVVCRHPLNSILNYAATFFHLANNTINIFIYL